jgi:hypothetical protein
MVEKVLHRTEEFEDTKGAIRIRIYRRRTDNTMVEYLSLNWHEIPVIEETVRMFIIFGCCKGF